MRSAASLWLIPIILGVVTHVADAKPTLAVLGLDVAGTATADATAVADDLTAALRAQVKARRGRFVLGPGTEVGLGAAKAQAACKDEHRACLIAIAANLGVDEVLFGRVESIKIGYQVTLRLFDRRSRRFLVALSDTIPTAEADRAKLHAAAKAMYAKITSR